MKVLIVGGDSRVAKNLIPNLHNYDVYYTTRRDPSNDKAIFLDLSKDIEDIGFYDTVVVLACDFKKGRSDKSQKKCWDVNVNGIIKALSRCQYDHLIYLSSYLAVEDTAYGLQKRAVEDWIDYNVYSAYILRPGKIETEEDMGCVIHEILSAIKERKIGIKNLFYKENENRCCNISI